MTKLLRKHGQVILAVLGSLLMIVFILPNIGNSNGSGGSEPLGKLAGKKVTTADLGYDTQDIEVLRRVQIDVSPSPERPQPASLFQVLVSGVAYPPPLTAYGYEIPPSIPLVPNNDYQSIHWHLLLHEAAMYGLVRNQADVNDFLVKAKLSGTDEEIEKAINPPGSSTKFSPGDLRRAVADALVIHNLAQLTLSAATVSLPEVEVAADTQLRKIDLAYATFDGTRDWEKSPAPAQEQIQKQFDLYKNTVVFTPPPAKAYNPYEPSPPVPQPPLIDGHHYPFGYRYPDRVKVEYLMFDRAQLAAKFQPTADDYDAAEDYYSKHPEQFSNVPSTSPSHPLTTAPSIKPWNEVKQELVQKQVDQRVTALLKKMADRAAAMANVPWKSAAASGADKVPQGQWAKYDTIAADLAADKEFLGFHPTQVAPPQWLSLAQAGELKDIGKAYFPSPTVDEYNRPAVNPIYFPRLATHVQDLVGPKDPDTVVQRLKLAVGPEGPRLVDAAGNLYVYRVVAAEKSHPPASVEEVKPQVIEDLKKMAAYQVQQAKARELAAKAAQEARGVGGDLLKLALAQSIPASMDKDLTRDGEIEALGPVPGLMDAAFGLTQNEAAGPAAAGPATASAPASTAAGGRTASVPDDAALKVYAIQLLSQSPPTGYDFQSRRREVVSRQNIPYERILFSSLELEPLAARLHYVPDTPFDLK